jgi:hypothetical protein
MQHTSYLALLLTLLLAGDAAAQEEVRTSDYRVFAGEAEKLHVDLSFGDLTIEGAEVRDVEVEVVFTCTRQDLEKCRRQADKIRLQPRVYGKTLDVQLQRTSRGRLSGISARMKLKVPRRLAVEVDARAGDVLVSNMDSDVEVDVGAGDVDLGHRQSLVGTVKVDVGVGNADLWLNDSRIEATGFPRSLTWRGSGTAKIEVDVGTGDVAVRLE